MSRQKGAFGIATFMWNVKRSGKVKSPTAGVNKYLPHSSEREIERRLKQLAKGEIRATPGEVKP